MRKKALSVCFALAAFIALLVACGKKEPLPANPYDSINRTPNTPVDTLDPTSFVWIHRNILAVKCANPGCHDGHFEPDYRSVQSSYATLVYHPVVKKLQPWKYRVQPYDTAKSWLWQRLAHDLIISGSDTSQGRMPLYSSALNATEMSRISTWILHGAKDPYGIVPKIPNNEPAVGFYLAFDKIPPVVIYSLDSNRADNQYYNPFYAPANATMYIAVQVTDDSTAISQLKVNQLKISTDMDNFSSAWTYTGSYVNTGSSEVYLFTLNTSVFPKQKTLYMRYYVNDGQHPQNTEMPRTDMLEYYKRAWAFYIK
jgi:hypothetical protein